MQQYDKAIAAFHKGIELDSTLTYTYGNIALAYTLLGQVDSALALLKKQQALQGGLPTGTQRANLAMTFAVAGRTTEARAEIAKLEQEVAKGRVANFQVASAYASLRDRANTLKWITQSVDEHESEPWFSRSCARHSSSSSRVTRSSRHSSSA